MNDINVKKPTSIIIPLIKAVLSGIVWGFGQLLNKQYLKALLFFIFFALFFGIELSSSNYFTEVNPYDKIEGKDMPSDFAEKFHKMYTNKVASRIWTTVPGYSDYYESVKSNGYTNEELYTFVVQDLQDKNPNFIPGDKYIRTQFTNYFISYIVDVYNYPGNYYTSADFSKLMVRLYIISVPEVKESYENGFYNFYNDKAGFFLKGLWSIITLGEQKSVTFYQQSWFSNLLPAKGELNREVFINTDVPVLGHQSNLLLLRAIISILLMMYFMFIYIWNIRDAYRTAKEIQATKKVPNEINYFKRLYENIFEYLALLPAFFIITFISIMPIIFGFLIAFTNYNFDNMQFFKWVGFENFGKLLEFGERSSGYGSAFARVFLWTLIWAVFSTATVFFGGFLQAVVLNNPRVIFRKVWRTFLILPWAVPALISQMIFRIMFNSSGVVNEFLRNIGVYKLLTNIGALGMPSDQVNTFWEKMIWLGQGDILWLNNGVNPWFTKTVLIVINIWLGFPFFMALMTGVMTGIDKTLYEAAEIDGATPKNKFKYITFPIVLSSTAPLLIMTFSGNFNNFGVIYFITGGGNNTSSIQHAYAGDTDILISWMYRLTIDSNNRMFNMASVFSILIFLIIGSIAAWNFTRMKAFKED